RSSPPGASRASGPDIEGLGVGRDPGVEEVRSLSPGNVTSTGKSSPGMAWTARSTASRTSWCAVSLVGSSRATEMTRPSPRPGTDSQARDASRTPVGSRRGEATIVRIVSVMGHCVVKNPAAGGGRWVEVPPERLVSWIVAFAQRHGGVASVTHGGATVTFTAVDGATAECHPPFPPLGTHKPFPPVVTPSAADEVRAAAEGLAAHAAAVRTVGVLLVRLGGYAVGVFAGSPPRLVS